MASASSYNTSCASSYDNLIKQFDRANVKNCRNELNQRETVKMKQTTQTKIQQIQ